MRWSLTPDLRRALRRSAPPSGVHRVQFAAGANLHEGAIVANFPWDGHPVRLGGGAAAALARHARGPRSAAQFDGRSSSSTSGSGGVLRPATSGHPSPDDATFRWLASTYAQAHAFMSSSTEFDGGITNGAAWYDIYGSLQDWSYVAGRCLDVTLELNQRKRPPASELPKLWEENRAALLALPLTAMLGGVRGRVLDAASGAALAAAVFVAGPVVAQQPPVALAADEPPAANATTPVFSFIPAQADSLFGFFARPAAPGTWMLRAEAPGYTSVTTTVQVPSDGSGIEATLLLERVV